MPISNILNIALQRNASDIHFTSGLQTTIRVDGELIPLTSEKIFTQEEILNFLKFMISEKQLSSFRKKEIFECDFRFEHPEVKASFRGNVFYSNNGISISLRVINITPPSLEDIKAPFPLKDACSLRNGLILITGPTGSGKSTTLAAMINYINSNFNKHIITIEDPIEYIHSPKNCLIHQRQISEHTNSFNEALRATLREDPDYILVGELRDLETIRLALTAAETGHLVFATLHTNSAAESIDRIVDVFHATEKELIRSMLANSLRLIVSQNLIKKIGGGRIAAMEIMICNTAIKNLIRENKIFQIPSAIQMGKIIGMQTMDDCIKNLAAKQIIDNKYTKNLL